MDKKRVILWSSDLGYSGCHHKGEFEVDEDTTDEEIQEIVIEQLFNRISVDWQEKHV